MVKSKLHKRKIKICHLYRTEMNVYGDTGNVLAFQWRLEQRGIDVDLATCGVGDHIPTDVDILFSGGGQDSGQFKIQKDLVKKSKTLQDMHRDGVVMLAICGLYQLLGHSFTTQQGIIKGASVFDMETKAGVGRLIGNVVSDSSFGTLVGFENHSGRTYLADTNMSLGKVVKGAGNNDEDSTEGIISNNAFGTYLHGPLLPKNPILADELIVRALDRKYGNGTQLAQVDDSYANKAAMIAKKLPR